jgi:hypothetical protein
LPAQLGVQSCSVNWIPGAEPPKVVQQLPRFGLLASPVKLALKQVGGALFCNMLATARGKRPGR